MCLIFRLFGCVFVFPVICQQFVVVSSLLVVVFHLFVGVLCLLTERCDIKTRNINIHFMQKLCDLSGPQAYAWDPSIVPEI